MNIFDIAIYAIAAIALIFVFFAIVMPYFAPQNHSKEIQTALQNAQISTKLGKTMTVGALTYAAGATILSDSFDKDKMLVAIECVSPAYCCAQKSEQKEKCTKAIDWDFTFFTSNEQKSIPTYVRCIKLSEVPVCKIYFGATPAQAAIDDLKILQIDVNGQTEVTTSLKDTGSLPITGGTLSVELQKKGPDGWAKTDYSQTPKSIDLLNAGEKITINWELAPQNLGEYRASFTFESQNAGFDKKTIDFNKTTNNTCIATVTGETLFDSDTNTYKELRECGGCNYAYECVSAWEAKENGKTFYPESNNSAYCTKQSFEGAC